MSKGLFSKFNVAAPRVQQEQQSSEGAGGNKTRYMRLGSHDCRIVEVEAPSELGEGRDPTWRQVRIILENAAGERGSHFLEIPTEQLEFTGVNKQGKQYTTMGPYNALVEFFNALGIKDDLGDPKVVAQTLERYFDNPNINRLVGTYLTVAFGYRKNEVGAEFNPESRLFVLKDGSGDTIKDNIGVEYTFPDRASAEGWARSNGKSFARFPRAMRFRATNGVDNSSILSSVKKKFTAFG